MYESTSWPNNQLQTKMSNYKSQTTKVHSDMLSKACLNGGGGVLFVCVWVGMCGCVSLIGEEKGMSLCFFIQHHHFALCRRRRDLQLNGCLYEWKGKKKTKKDPLEVKQLNGNTRPSTNKKSAPFHVSERAFFSGRAFFMSMLVGFFCCCCSSAASSQ